MCYVHLRMPEWVTNSSRVEAGKALRAGWGCLTPSASPLDARHTRLMPLPAATPPKAAVTGLRGAAVVEERRTPAVAARTGGWTTEGRAGSPGQPARRAAPR